MRCISARCRCRARFGRSSGCRSTCLLARQRAAAGRCGVFRRGVAVGRDSADLAAAAALVSSLANAPLPADAVYFGEVSLSGAIRPVAQGPARLKEAAKLGFTRAIVPEAARAEAGEPGLKVTDVASLSNLVADIAARGSRGPGGKTRGQDG